MTGINDASTLFIVRAEPKHASRWGHEVQRVQEIIHEGK